jgi:uncharacterized protein YbjQ (UPF0145 family)
MNQPPIQRPPAALSDLSVTEFLTLSRMGFLPHGVVVGDAIVDAGINRLYGQTRELDQMSHAMRVARQLAVTRMREQAQAHRAEGVVGVRMQVEHHKWRGGHHVVKILALGTAVAFDPAHAPPELGASPLLTLADGRPFTSALSGQDFVTLLRAGYRPVSVAMGCCVFELNALAVRRMAGTGQNEEVVEYTRALSDAREAAMSRMTRDLFADFGVHGARHAEKHPDAPAGVVGMKVSETTHAGAKNVIEYTAVGTAVAHLRQGDPRKADVPPAPQIVVSLDR